MTSIVLRVPLSISPFPPWMMQLSCREITTHPLPRTSNASGDLNATDADGLTDGSYFSISTAPANGSAAIDPVDGNWTHIPNPNFFGSDSFAASTTDDLNTSSTTSQSLHFAVDDATSASWGHPSIHCRGPPHPVISTPRTRTV